MNGVERSPPPRRRCADMSVLALRSVQRVLMALQVAWRRNGTQCKDPGAACTNDAAELGKADSPCGPRRSPRMVMPWDWSRVDKGVSALRG